MKKFLFILTICLSGNIDCLGQKQYLGSEKEIVITGKKKIMIECHRL